MSPGPPGAVHPLGGLDLGDGDHPAIPQVEAGLGVGCVFDQHLVGRELREQIVERGRPGLVRINRARRSRDHLTQIELDLLSRPSSVQLGLESYALRQGQAGFLARLPA